MPRLARLFVFAMLVAGFSGTGCGVGNNNTGEGDGKIDGVGGDAGNSGGGIGNGSGAGGTITVNNCGNAQLNMGETCDDGNKAGGDGCSATCQIEGNSMCTTPGQGCVSVAVCGDTPNARARSLFLRRRCSSRAEIFSWMRTMRGIG